MKNNHQLIKKDKSLVFPKTFLDAIKSRETGQTLDEILQGFNMYFVSYNGNIQVSRCLVPIELRKRGLWVTYINFLNEVVTEWYDANEIDNNSWGDNKNWRVATNRLIGDISISANGNWVVNGKELNAKAKGDKGETPILRYNNLTLEVSYNKGKKWEELTKFENKLLIKGYVTNVGDLPKDAIQGDIWMVGPTYDEGDELLDSPHYRMWVRNNDAWKDNGEFTSISAGITLEVTDEEITIPSNKAVATTLGKLDEQSLFTLEYIKVILDNENNFILGVRVDGTTYILKLVSPEIIDLYKNKEDKSTVLKLTNDFNSLAKEVNNSEIKATDYGYYNGFLPNPLNSLCSQRSTLTDTPFAIKNKYETPFASTEGDFRSIIYIKDVLPNSVFENGDINYNKVKDVLRTLIYKYSVNKGTRIILGVFADAPVYTGGWGLYNYDLSPDGIVYAYLEDKAFNYFKLDNSLIPFDKGTPSWVFKETNYFSFLNPNSSKVYNLFDNLLRVLKEILEEPCSSYMQDDSGNYKSVKVGDYTPTIAILPFGTWGEGDIRAYKDCNVEDLINIVELYKKYLYDYILLACSLSTDASRVPDTLVDYPFYLFSTSYGNAIPSEDGKYYGTKRFGIEQDHMTSNYAVLLDFTVKRGNEDIKPLIWSLWQKAPFYGESANGFLQVEDFEAIVKTWRYTGMSLWNDYTISSHEKNLALRGFNLMGYRLAMMNTTLSVSDTITGKIRFANLGVGVCFDNWWDLLIVQRDPNDGHLLSRTSITSDISGITRNPTSGLSPTTALVVTININVPIALNRCDVFLCIKDSKNIDVPMFLANVGRNKHGEYCLWSAEENHLVNYHLDNETLNAVGNPSTYNLFENIELKDPYKDDYIFDGWYLDYELTKKIKFLLVDMIGLINIYPKFIKL